ncbi:unnamed protein product, partial [Allacma fusca]
MKKPRFGGAVL